MTESAEQIKNSLEALFLACHKSSFAAGWYHNPETGEPYLVNRGPNFFEATELLVPTKLMLIVSEIAEAMEGHRKGSMDDKLPHRSALETELADALIRIGDLSAALRLDVAGAVLEKMRFNIVRPDHKLENRRKPGGKKY